MASQSTIEADVFNGMDQYPWELDEEFQNGLNAILESDSSPEKAESLTLQAQCFYYSRKRKVTIDLDSYLEWRSQRSSGDTSKVINPSSHLEGRSVLANPAPTASTTSAPDGSSKAALTSGEAAPYPTSFNQIVDLITNGQAVPGIKDIPDTVLSGQYSKPKTAKRMKPWEMVNGTSTNIAVVTPTE